MFDIRNITEDEAKKQLEYLAKEIEKADIAYYQNDAPYLDDAAYDKLRRLNDALEAKFPALIRNDSPSKRVGAMVRGRFNYCGASRDRRVAVIQRRIGDYS